MPSAKLGSLAPIQEETQKKVGHIGLRCPGNSEKAAYSAPTTVKGEEKHKYSVIYVQVQCLITSTHQCTR